jgi:hypothetical protein
LESGPIHERVPDQSLVALNTRGSDGGLSPNLRCAMRAPDGAWAMIYSTRGEMIRVVMSRLGQGTADAGWYNPRTGRWRADGDERATRRPFERAILSGPGAPDRCFDAPGGAADGNDWVLALDTA